MTIPAWLRFPLLPLGLALYVVAYVLILLGVAGVLLADKTKHLIQWSKS